VLSISKLVSAGSEIAVVYAGLRREDQKDCRHENKILKQCIVRDSGRCTARANSTGEATLLSYTERHSTRQKSEDDIASVSTARKIKHLR